MSGDPREWQWLHQRLSLAVVRGNTASILTCVQIWSNFICTFLVGFSVLTSTLLAPVSMCSYWLPNPCSFCKFRCPLWTCAITRATKSQWSQHFSTFIKVSNVHKSNFILIPWATPKLLGQKSQNLSLGQNLSVGQSYLAVQFFLFINILLKLQQQILSCVCKFGCNSVIIIVSLFRFLS